MPALHRLASLRLFALGVVLALPLACWQVGASVSTSRSELVVAGALLECPVGAEGCPCTSGGGCDPGLICMSGMCTSGASGGAGGGEAYYEFEDDLAAPPAPPAPMRTTSETLSISASVPGVIVRGRKLERAEKRRNKNFSKDLPSGGPMAPEESMPAAKPAPILANTTASDDDDDSSTPEVDGEARQVIYTASLQVAVYELDAAIELAESLPQRYGGWIDSRYDYQITLRLPAEHLFEAMAELGALGLVIGKTLRADDVTSEYTDLESRILVLEQLVEQLELLLAKAKTVEEALKIRVELDRVRIELEAARVRMRSLSELIDFSTLTLVFSARGPVDALPASNDPFPWVDDLGVETTEYR